MQCSNVLFNGRALPYFCRLPCVTQFPLSMQLFQALNKYILKYCNYGFLVLYITLSSICFVLCESDILNQKHYSQVKTTNFHLKSLDV